MTKNGNDIAKAKNWIGIVVGILTISTIVGGGFLAWASVGVNKLDAKVGANERLNEASHLVIDVCINKAVADVDDLEAEGCKPAQKTTYDVIAIQKDLESIRKDVEKNRSEQQQGFKEIMTELRK